ncbi:MAG: HepT-like ribonuclease domain-containing protein [Dehalococcoidia bacterium]
MRDDTSLLLDILLAADEARTLAAPSTYEDLLEDRKLQLSLVKLIEIIGEAAGRLSEEARAGAPGVPWHNIIGMRHRLVHDYGRIDFAFVWQVVQNGLPPLMEAITPLLPPDSPSGSA